MRHRVRREKRSEKEREEVRESDEFYTIYLGMTPEELDVSKEWQKDYDAAYANPFTMESKSTIARKRNWGKYIKLHNQ